MCMILIFILKQGDKVFVKHMCLCDVLIFLFRDIIALVKDKVYARISLAGFSIHQVIPLSL